MNKKIISFALLGLLLGSSVQIECAISFKKVAILTSAVVAGLAIYRYNAKKTEKEPISRFETEKLKAAVNANDFKEVANQVWYFIDDLIVGQPRKSDGVVADKEGKLEVKKGNPSSGLMGFIDGQISPISKGLVAISTVVALYNFKAILKYYNNLMGSLESACE